MAAAAILVLGVRLPVSILSDRGCCIVRVFQSSSRSVNIWPSYNDFCKFKMAAAFRFRFCPIGDVIINVCVKFHQDRSIFGRVTVISVISRRRRPPSWFLKIYFQFLCLSNKACCEEPACQISSRSVDIWLSYSDFSEFKMAAAAILVFEFLLPVFVLSHKTCC